MFKTYTPLEYLKIDIASNFDTKVLEKSNFEDRIQWFDDNESNLDSLTHQAENQSLFYAGLEAYKAFLNNQPTGYLISMDATASGIQLLSCLIGCETSARACGLINDNRIDAYMYIYDKLNVCDSYTRKQIKNVVMTAIYSSKEEPRKLFGTDTEDLNNFYKTLETYLPGCWGLKNALEGLWNNKVLSHEYILPDNFNAILPVMVEEEETFTLLGEEFLIKTEVNKPSNNYCSIAANTVHSVDGFVVREMQRRCNFNPKQINYIFNLLGSKNKSLYRNKDVMVQTLWNHYLESNILSLRILDYLDYNNFGLIDQDIIKDSISTLPNKRFDLLTIHDAFKCHPNYGNDVRYQYNKLLSEICNSNLLQYIARQITNDNSIIVNKYGNIGELVLNTNYALS